MQMTHSHCGDHDGFGAKVVAGAVASSQLGFIVRLIRRVIARLRATLRGSPRICIYIICAKRAPFE